jgi:hypothetical protein
VQSRHRLSHALVLVVDGRTGNQKIGTRTNNQWNRGLVDASINFDIAM